MAIESSLTIPDFCALEKISRSFFYKIDKAGIGPSTYWVGSARRITPEAYEEYRRTREAASNKDTSTTI
jgi:hypothetical protein